MERLQRVFDSFSRRGSARQGILEIPGTLRYRLLHWVSEVLFDVDNSAEKRQFMLRLHADLRMRLGRGQLSPQSRDDIEDVALYWNNCAGERFLDIIEDLCRVAYELVPSFEPDEFTGAINHLLNEDSLPYALTKFTIESPPSGQVLHKFQRGVTARVTAFPRIILREEEFTHRGLIEPVLNLLAFSSFKTANEEFRAALQHYRKAE